ncbi:MAG: hypothetical protein AABX66_01895 [Nanoarchaeota archaeon]
MALEGVIISFLQNYTSALAFVAGLMLGDALILLAALAGAGKLNIITIFVFAVLGEIVHDTVFFYFSKSSVVHYIKRKLKLHKGDNKAAQMIERLADTKLGYFLPLFLAKFVYGIRDSVILYVGHKEKDFRKYFLTCLAATVSSILVVLTLGWFAGLGFTEIIPIFKGIEKGVGILLITVIVAYVLYRLLGKGIIKFAKKYYNKIEKSLG